MFDEINIYRVKIFQSSTENEGLPLYIYLFPDEYTSKPENKKMVNLSRTTDVFCEPPTPARYIKLQTLENRVLELCEVEIYGAGTKARLTSF